MLKKVSLTTQFNDVVNITDEIKKIVKESGIKEGVCHVYNPHSTAGLTSTSFWDPNGWLDLQEEICRLIPTRIDFKHQHDTPQDAAAHIKSSLLGISMSFIIDSGELLVGSSQGVFFLEFDGPRNRHYFVKVIAG